MARPTIVRLAEQDVSAAAAALALAFQNDPLQTYVFPDPVERAARSPAHFAPLLRYGLLFTSTLASGAWWKPWSHRAGCVCGRFAETARHWQSIEQLRQASLND